MKRPYLFLLIATAAAGAVLLLANPFSEKRGDRLDLPLLVDVTLQDIDRIEIEHLLDGVQLKKENGEWQAARFLTTMKQRFDEEAAREKKQPPPQPVAEEWIPADKDRIELALQVLFDTRLTALAGKNRERHGYFEVNAAGQQIRFFDAGGKKRAHFYIGKAGPGFTESYFRREGEENVYLTDRYLRTHFPVAVEDWKAKAAEKKEEAKQPNPKPTPRKPPPPPAEPRR